MIDWRPAGGLFVPLTRWVQHPPDPDHFRSDQLRSEQSRTPITFSILESLWVKLEALVCDDIFGFHSDTPPHQHTKICSENKLSKKKPKTFS